jgi:hypothetical protein
MDRGTLRFCIDRQLSGAGRYSIELGRPLPAETVEFSVSHASEERMPFVRCKPQDRSFGLPAVANADAAIGEVRYLDAITIGETQRTLNPVRT